MSRFDHGAKEWDKKERRLRLAQDVAAAIEKKIVLNDESVVMDFGCGTGLILFHFAEKAGQMVGFDSSEGMLDVLMEKAKDMKADNVKGLKFDLYKEDFGSNNYDAAITSMVLHHLEKPEVFINKAYKGLKDGGQIFIADLNEEDGSFHDNMPDDVHHLGFTEDKFKNMLQDAGFKNVDVSKASEIEKEKDGEKRKYAVLLAYGEK